MQLLLFGALADITGKTALEINGIKNTDELQKKIFMQYPGLVQRPFLIAVNKKVTIENAELKDDDVVALLPPFSGG